MGTIAVQFHIGRGGGICSIRVQVVICAEDGMCGQSEIQRDNERDHESFHTIFPFLVRR